MFERLFRAIGYERRDLTLAQWPWLPVPNVAGVLVSADTALRSPTTLAAVRCLVETIGGLPVHLYRRGDGNERTRVSDHPAVPLIRGDANPWTGSVDLRMQLMRDVLLHGRAFAQVIRTRNEPRELHRLPPDAVSVELLGSGEPTFLVRINAEPDRVLGIKDVLFLQTPGATPDRPIKLLDLANEAIGVDMAMSGHQARLFANGAKPSGILKMPGTVTPGALERLKAAWQSIHGGTNTGGTAILEGGMEFQQLALSCVDTQFLELRRFVVSEIARAFRVPSTLVGDFDRAVWRNVEELGRQFLQHTVLPWLEIWQTALTRVLLTPDERQTLYFEWLVDDLMRADLAARFAAYRNATGGSWLTPNEVRAHENRPPIEGGDELIRQAGQGGAEGGPQSGPPSGSEPDADNDDDDEPMRAAA